MPNFLPKLEEELSNPFIRLGRAMEISGLSEVSIEGLVRQKRLREYRLSPHGHRRYRVKDVIEVMRSAESQPADKPAQADSKEQTSCLG